MDKNRRMAQNTGFLYVKLVFTTIVSLFSARYVLMALGATDFGIFNLVGGIILMLSFLNSAMAIATQRFLSYYMGAGDTAKVKILFSSSVFLHLMIGLVVVILLEIAGLFIFNGVLNIPEERIGTAKIIFHFMVVSTFFTINAVPFDAAINAHENMLFDAIAGVFESLVKLGIAICLLHVHVDRLILYGLMIAGLTVFMRFLKSIYCVKKYEECNYGFKHNIDYSLLKEMFAFAAWSLYGSFCSVIRNQGLAVLLNLFYGVIVNAAYGIANQVNGTISAFSSSLIRAMYPQITKSEGGGDRERMIRLSVMACRIAFLLFALFSVPLIVEMPFVLEIWLDTVPENTVIFCQLILVLSLLQQLTIGIIAAITSVGKIKVYQIIMGSLLLLNLPISLVLIKLGLPSYSVLICAIGIELVAIGTRIWMAHNLIGLKIRNFIFGVVLNSLFTALVATGLSIIPRLFLDEGILRAGIVLLISFCSLTIFATFVIFTKEESKKMRSLVLDLLKKPQNVSTDENTY